MPSTADLIDTAIKIGLGAMISSAGGYWLARLNHSKDAEKERLRRRREILEQVAEQAESFTHVGLRLWAVATEITGKQSRGEAINPKRQRILRERQQELFDAFKDISSAEAKLLLLGETAAQGLLRDYGESVGAFRSLTFKEYTETQAAAYQQARADLLGKRAQFFKELSEVYARPSTRSVIRAA